MRPVGAIPLFIIMMSFSFAATINVPSDIITIQGGIDSAEAGDTVLVASGVYFENLNYNGKGITVISSSGPENTTIDGAAKGPVLQMVNGEPPSALFEGFTVQNGSGLPMLTNPNGRFGGGICLRYAASPTLRNLIVKNNSALGTQASGGGIGVSTGSEAVIEDVTIMNNVAFFGGGLYCYYASPTIRNVEIKNNTATASGAGATFQGSTPTLEYILIHSNNSGDSGGGIWFYDETYATLRSVTIYGNTAEYMYGGGGIITTAKNYVYIVNSIIRGNTPQQVASYVTSVYPAGTIGIAYSNIEDGEDGLYLQSGELAFYENNMDSDPEFSDIFTHNYSLSDSSPCIDAGTSSYIVGPEIIVDLSPDQYNGEAPDMGVFESLFQPISVDPVENLVSNVTLHQNYPNPFNPSTTISYSIPEISDVKLTIYDVRGRTILTHNELQKQSGSYEFTWNGADAQGLGVPTGVYFARLEAGDISQTIKMLLLK